MKVALVTTDPQCYIFDSLYKERLEIDIILVSLSKRKPKSIFKKIRKVGLLASIINFFFRKTYQIHSNVSVYDLEQKGYKITRIQGYNHKALNSVEYDLGISATNSLIPESFFSFFKNGMLNIHHEILPERRGAQPIFWSIFDKTFKTGFTIHEINSKLDAGNILYKEIVDLDLKQSKYFDFIYSNTKKIKEISAQKILDFVKKEEFDPLFELNLNVIIPNRFYTSPKLSEHITAYYNWKNVKR